MTLKPWDRYGVSGVQTMMLDAVANGDPYRMDQRVVASCIRRGWLKNNSKRGVIVLRLTELGQSVLAKEPTPNE